MKLARIAAHLSAFAFGLAAAGCDVKPAEGTSCLGDFDCPEDEACTDHFCDNGFCSSEPVIAQECEEPACVSDDDCFDDDDCTNDYCAADGSCVYEPIEDCGADGPASGVADLYVADDGDAMLFAVHAIDPIYEAYLDEQEAAADMPIGTCAPLMYTSPGAVDLISMGDLTLQDGSTVVAMVPPDQYNRYDSYETPFIVAVGQFLDLIIGGASPSVLASTIFNAFEVPPQPAFTNLTFAGDTFNGTATYDPVPADRLFLTYSYFTTEPETVRCRLDPDAGTFTMDAATYAALGASGQIRAEVQNRRRGALDAADEERALLLSTTRSTASGNFTKAP